MEEEQIVRGTMTSEFWISAIPAAVAVFENFKDDSETSSNMLALAFGLGALYLICRTALKMMELWVNTKRATAMFNANAPQAMMMSGIRQD